VKHLALLLWVKVHDRGVILTIRKGRKNIDPIRGLPLASLWPVDFVHIYRTDVKLVRRTTTPSTIYKGRRAFLRLNFPNIPLSAVS
jgi:hypothetical protein